MHPISDAFASNGARIFLTEKGKRMAAEAIVKIVEGFPVDLHEELLVVCSGILNPPAFADAELLKVSAEVRLYFWLSGVDLPRRGSV